MACYLELSALMAVREMGKVAKLLYKQCYESEAL